MNGGIWCNGLLHFISILSMNSTLNSEEALTGYLLYPTQAILDVDSMAL